jgi:hypothetical protein
LGKEGVSFDPAETVEMRNVASIELTVMVGDAHLSCEFEVVKLEPSLEERIIESITVVARNDVGVVALNELSESQESGLLGGFVED